MHTHLALRCLAVLIFAFLNTVALSDHMLSCMSTRRRFGVRQKQKLRALCPALHPHMLTMSATPIPRTLALTRYAYDI